MSPGLKNAREPALMRLLGQSKDRNIKLRSASPSYPFHPPVRDQWAYPRASSLFIINNAESAWTGSIISNGEGIVYIVVRAVVRVVDGKV
jgi:hypothetical protein